MLLVGLLSSPVQAFSRHSRRAFVAVSSSSLISTPTMTGTTTTKDNQTAKVWDRFAEGYSKQPIGDEEAYQKKLQITQQLFRPNMNVLEFGCGTGGTSILHAPYVHRILATDISSKMIDIAKQKAQEANVQNVEFRQASIDELKLPDQSQDVVLGMSILHLLDNKDDAIAKTYKWLKPGGRFVTSTVCIGDMGFATKMFMTTVLPIGRFIGYLPTVNAMTKSELRNSMTRNGFKIEQEWQPKEGAAVFMVAKKE